MHYILTPVPNSGILFVNKFISGGTLLDIRLKSHVACTDGRIGRLENIILNPHTGRVTYVVVKENGIENTQRLVPERLIQSATPETISLSIDKERFKRLKHFIQEDYIPADVTFYMAETLGWDAGTPAAVFVEHESVPAGGTVVRKGEKVLATDGQVGQVDEFLAPLMDMGRSIPL